MAYPQIVEYNAAVQNPTHAFIDPELKGGDIKLSNLGLPIVLSGGFALTYTLNTPRKKYAVRCFHREIPSIEQKYNEISRKLKSLKSGYFVDFDFQRAGIKVQQQSFPIVKMDWIDGDPLGIWLDKNVGNAGMLQKLRSDFRTLASFLEMQNIAHGDIQNGNVMLASGVVKLIDYDGMFVDGLPQGKGSETGHKHFQHPDRTAIDFGPKMDRFSFIALDLSLQAVAANPALYKKFRDGGETIIFKANDFADPQNSEIFRVLMSEPKLKDQARNFAAICDAPIEKVPTLEDFLAGKNIPASAPSVMIAPTGAKPIPRQVAYIPAFPVVNALDYGAAERRVGDRVELIGRIVEVKTGVGKWGRSQRRPYVFINFGPWRGRIVKISIWSEGLAKLREKPSASWVGRWVSVTGLMDPPYINRRHGYSHLSVSVEEDGQIQQLPEAEAQFRLASAGLPTHQRNRNIVETIVRAGVTSSASVPPPPVQRQVTPSPNISTATPSANQALVDLIKRGVAQGNSQSLGSTPPHRPTTGQSASASAPPSLAPSVAHHSVKAQAPTRVWLWIGAAIIALVIVLQLIQRPTTNTAPVTPRTVPSKQSAPETKQPIQKQTNLAPANGPGPIRRLDPSPVPAPQLEPPLRRPANDVGGPVEDGVPPEAPNRSTIDPVDLTTNVPSVRHLDVRQVDQAKKVQQRLIDLGYLSGPADGLWGPRSRGAVQDFRSAHHIGESDVWDEKTEQSLFAENAIRADAIQATFVGGWGIDAAQCGQSANAPLVISNRAAQVTEGRCDFLSVQRDGVSAWNIQATCVLGADRWNSSIRLVLVGNRLTWSSALGTAIYLRCSSR